MDNLYKKIYKYLLSCGFSPAHKGYKLIIEAVIMISDSKPFASLSNIYTVLSQKYNISSYSVQKNIKNAIDYASLNCNIDFFAKEFEHLSKNGGISCGAFLYFISDKMKYE